MEDQARMTNEGDGAAGLQGSARVVGGATPTRRDTLRAGVKAAFIAPVITTFFAAEAFAMGSNLSCYPAGHACDGGSQEPCCSGVCIGAVCQ